MREHACVRAPGISARARACTRRCQQVGQSGGARGTARGAVHAARGQNLTCVDVDKAALVGEIVYRERIHGRDDLTAHNRLPHKRGFAKE